LTSHDEPEPGLIERGQKMSCKGGEPVLRLEDDDRYHSHLGYSALPK